MTDISCLTEEHALSLAKIIRPSTNFEKSHIIRNDTDYLVIKADNYLAEEIWFFKKHGRHNKSNFLHVYHQHSEVNYDYIFLVYQKVIELGYKLHIIR